MKKLAQIGAVLSFTFFLLPGLVLVIGGTSNHEPIVAILGFCSLGVACFFGTILWLAGEHYFPNRKQE